MGFSVEILTLYRHYTLAAICFFDLFLIECIELSINHNPIQCSLKICVYYNWITQFAWLFSACKKQPKEAETMY